MLKTPPIQRDAAKVELKPCPNPWCCARTPPLPCALKRDGWRVLCECGVASWRKPTEAEAVEAWNQRDLRPDDALRAGVQASIEFIEQKAASLRTSGIAGGLDPSEAELLDLHISDIADSLRAMHLAATLNERNPKP